LPLSAGLQRVVNPAVPGLVISSSAGRSQLWVVSIQSKGCRPLRCCNSRPPAAAILRVRAGCSPRARQWLCRSGTCWRQHRCDRGLLATFDSCPPSLPTGGVTSFVRSCTKYLAACCTSCSAATGNRGREASSTSPTTADGPGLEDGLALTGTSSMPLYISAQAQRYLQTFSTLY
jgi:hypothetical protein